MTDPPTIPSAVIRLGCLVVVLAAVAAALGTFAGGGPGRHEITGLHGGTVTLYGEGLFRDDTLLIGAGNRGQDLVVLLVEVPLLAALLAVARRGGLRAQVLLTATLGFFAYYYASMCVATAYNRIFPLYVALFAAATFALALLAPRIDADRVAAAFPAGPIRRVVAGYLLVVAALLTAVWLPPMLGAVLSGDPPTLTDRYTSEPTWALDLGLVVPLAVCAVVLLRRGRPLGYLLATLLTMGNLTIGLVLISQGVAQVLAGALTTAEVLGMVVSFAALTVVAAGVLLAILRGWHDPAVPRATQPVSS